MKRSTKWIFLGWMALLASGCGGGSSEEGGEAAPEDIQQNVDLGQQDVVSVPDGSDDPGDVETPPEDTALSPCNTGTISGGICDPGNTEELSCGQVSFDAPDCHGNMVSVSIPLPSGGGFVLPDVPTGVVTVIVEVGAFKAECKLFVQSEQTAFATINQCTCEGDDCGSIFSPVCWPEDAVDLCNCQDDDCDGVIDEDCIDDCNCADDDCDGEIDEDCIDGCNGVDEDCDGVIDEDCEFVNECTNPPEIFDDCDGNDVPDECPICPPVDIVFLIDTSGSMTDELEALCEGIDITLATLEVVDIETDAEILGISEVLNCTHDTVVDKYGKYANGGPSELPELADCDAGQGHTEDWGPAIAVVAGNKTWTPGSLRVIVPITDEGPSCGSPVDAEDVHGIIAAKQFALEKGVLIYPILGNGTPADVEALAQEIALFTGGNVQSSTDAGSDLATLVLTGMFDACSSASDCNDNGVPDTCDLAEGAPDCNGNDHIDSCDIAVLTSTDCDVNGQPDDCDMATGIAIDCNENGLSDACDVLDEELDTNGNGVPDSCEGTDEGGVGEEGAEEGAESGDEDGAETGGEGGG